MSFVLPDSKGSIHKILFHQSSAYQNDRQIRKGIFENLLKNLNRIGVKPKVYVFTTYRNNAERTFLEDEANDWKPFVSSLNYAQIKVSDEIWSKLAYAQDTCVITNPKKPAAIMTRAGRYRDMIRLLSKTGLLQNAGLKIVKPRQNFILEGGHIYACTKILLYSNPKDREVVELFKQTPIFIKSIISELINGMLDILYPGTLTYNLPDHVDLIFSIFEREGSFDVFHVNFKEATLSSPIWYNYRRQILLNRRFKEWDNRLQKIIEKIKKRLKNATFHKIPGFIGYETLPQRREFFVYSGVNLLFHSDKDRDYAFYLKSPSEVNEHVQINQGIESALRSVNITPIPIIGKNEYMNLAEIRNSAGIRCLVKVLARN